MDLQICGIEIANIETQHIESLPLRNLIVSIIAFKKKSSGVWILITLIKNQIQQFVDFNYFHMEILIEELNLQV